MHKHAHLGIPDTPKAETFDAWCHRQLCRVSYRTRTALTRSELLQRGQWMVAPVVQLPSRGSAQPNAKSNYGCLNEEDA